MAFATFCGVDSFRSPKLLPPRGSAVADRGFQRTPVNKKLHTGIAGGGWNGPSIMSKLLPSIGRPISIPDFTHALLATWKPQSSRQHEATSKLGLAISGGVDSMALAVLCSKIQNRPECPKFTFQAFVVDHGVRKGSDHEAISVSKVLENKGIPTEVLKIHWGSTEEPGKRPDFESLARKYRFQALGNACRGKGINSLLLAHHEDDQAESVMMRMINGHRALGLRGMQGESRIPECYGIHGVHQSGAHVKLLIPNSRYVKRSNPLVIERGGINIYRPLLAFGKSRLIATCQAEETEWFDDPTNKDPSLTMRNAVRHLFRTAKLPTALQPESILRLSEKCKQKDIQLKAAAQNLLEKNPPSVLDTRSGTLIIQFPELAQLALSGSELSQADCGLVAAHLLRKAITLVSPEKQVELPSLHRVAVRMFPELLDATTVQSETTGDSNALPTQPISHISEQTREANASLARPFTVSGVYFQPLISESVTPTSAYQRRKWLLSRQPYPHTASARPCLSFPPSGQWSPWSLYDGRFWFRFLNGTDRTYYVRPFREDDWKAFRASKWFLADLKKRAPASVKWTLPALVVEESPGKERVAALPTFHHTIRDYEDFEDVCWEVRYKNVEVEGLRKTGSCIIC
ncbi:mitochondrial tRNA-lysidine synthetase [Calycina marina]|uniref:tRNA(Ile)-lysidine synthetase n=1 Tax=Calycina marina TaxID=1763456 RepID=A0A9P7ZBL0_9HELO|nr:mitochondrial tRNA-lysidine synthetase [Calycina marina]